MAIRILIVLAVLIYSAIRSSTPSSAYSPSPVTSNQTSTASWREAKPWIFPMVVNKSFAESMIRRELSDHRKNGASPKAQKAIHDFGIPVSRPLLDLAVVYQVNNGTNKSFVRKGMLDDWIVTPAELQAVAIENMEKIEFSAAQGEFEPYEVRATNPAHEPYIASLLATEKRLYQLLKDADDGTDHPFYVIAPYRDILMAVREGEKRMLDILLPGWEHKDVSSRIYRIAKSKKGVTINPL